MTEQHNYLILSVDPHPVAFFGLSWMLPDYGLIHVRTLQEARDRMSHTSYDLVILEMRIDDDPLHFVRQLKSTQRAPRVLIFTSLDDPLYEDRFIRAGADGFLSKTASVDDLYAAITSIKNGKPAFRVEAYQRVLSLARGERDLHQDPIETLSDRELQVFQMLGEGKKTGTIAASLNLSPKTIETYRENIKTKLGLADGTALMHAAVTWVVSRKG